MESLWNEVHDASVSGLQIGRPEGTLRLYFDKLGKQLVFTELTFVYLKDLLIGGIIFDVKVHLVQRESEESILRGNELLAQLAAGFSTSIIPGLGIVFLTEISSSYGVSGVTLSSAPPVLIDAVA
jgi:hypothetical protein